MIAGYQKYLEGAFDLTNATRVNVELMNEYGQDGLHIDGHSRGPMTTGNAMEALANQSATGVLSSTTINFFGPAYNVSNASTLLGYLRGSGSGDIGVQYQNHMADPVGILIGGNPPTGGTLPLGTSLLLQMVRAATGQSTTSHNCYGLGGVACGKFWDGSAPSYRSTLNSGN